MANDQGHDQRWNHQSSQRLTEASTYRCAHGTVFKSLNGICGCCNHQGVQVPDAQGGETFVKAFGAPAAIDQLPHDESGGSFYK